MTAASVRSPWVISPLKDGLFFFASALVVFIVWFSSSVLKIDGFHILAAVAVASNGPHLISTWTRVYFDRREWKDRPVAIFVAPALIFAFVAWATWKGNFVFGSDPATATTINGTRVLNSAILYWATWHFVAQNWGILRVYQRKSGEPETSVPMKLEKPLLMLFVLWTLLHRLYTGPRMLFGSEIYYLNLPRPLVDGLLAPIIIVTGIYLVQRFQQRHQPWARASLIRIGFLFCAFLGFFVPFQLITSDDTSAFAAAACWHGFQYLGMMRHFHRTSWKSGIDPQAKIISWLGQPGWVRGILYWAMLMAMAGAVYGFIFGLSLITRNGSWNFYTWGGVVWISLTLSHYWLDGVIWKLRKPELAKRLGVEVEAQATAS